MRRIPHASIAAISVLTFALAGCSVTVSNMAPPDEIARLAEDALEAQIGQRPEIDCGTESIVVKVGTVVPCLLLDPGTNAEFDVAVTITEVDGNNVKIHAKVADTPNNVPDTGQQPTDDGSLTLSATEIAATAEKAILDANLLPNPAVVCPGETHSVTEGYTLDCTVINGGDQYAGQVTITRVEGSSYSLTINIEGLSQ